MYIILKGSIGVYLTNFFGNLTEVAKLSEGDFFGEMAIFDNLPRSASCIALEDSICVAITKGNLRDFFVNCPDLAERVVFNMSNRIRNLNNELYKNAYTIKKRRTPRFSVPSAYAFSHTMKEPYQNPRYCRETVRRCPLCGAEIPVKTFSRHLMEVRQIHPDGKIDYVDGNPLWHKVYSCPKCHYSNHFLSFFQVNEGNRDLIRTVLERDQQPVVRAFGKKAPFDLLVQRYLQAIHLNEVLNPGECVRIGSLWLNLYWLSKEADDNRFAKYCAQRAVKKFRTVLDAGQVPDTETRGSVVLALVNLMDYLDVDREDIPDYCAMASDCTDPNVQENLNRFVNSAN